MQSVSWAEPNHRWASLNRICWRQGWGKAVVEQFAADLRTEFPGVGGFSASNLWRMKAFFEAYTGLEKLASLVREIGWSHNLAILERCKDPLEREFYLRITRKFGWSKIVGFGSLRHTGRGILGRQ